MAFLRFASRRRRFDAAGVSPTYLVFEGDSLTFAHYYVDAVIAALGVNYRSINVAAGGETWTQMIAAAAAQVDPWKPISPLVSIAAGINDLVHTAETAATVLTRAQTYVTARLAAGWTSVVLYTLTPCDDAGAQASGYEARRLTYNQGLRDNYVAWGAAGLVDVGADAIMGQVATCSDPIYYNADKLHWTQAGHAIVAALAYAVIEPLT